VSDSEPPCRAVLLAQELYGPAAALDVAAALARSFYEAGLPPDAEATVEQAARTAGVDPAPLLERYRANADGRWTRAHFEQARAEGVEQYPSLFLDRGEGLELVVEGCLDAPTVLFTLERALAEAP
jgi:protein-disulfide isomerase-like protein with CxxC motif